MSHIPYTSAVESLMYVMVSTRPCISHAIGVVNIYMENTTIEYWAVMKHECFIILEVQVIIVSPIMVALIQFMDTLIYIL